ncbi:MAG: cysteine peptidase family C39 domain-containing protein [Verrucomicrobiota bacterium]|jgi:hypothetical protein
MNPWVESGVEVLLAVGGIYAAFRLARAPRPYWLAVWLLALGVVFLFSLPRYAPGLEFVPPFSWIAATRTRFVLFPLIIPILLLVPAAKRPGARLRFFLAVLTGLAVLKFSVLPALLPAFNRNLLLHLTTRIDRDGVCLQGTAYTCGPAAAVTALRRLGLPAEEGEIAVWARTTSVAGTPSDVLAETLREHYGSRGVTATLRYFKTIPELRHAGLSVAVIKFDFLEDHYVTILSVTDREVVAGDPLNGLVTYSYDDFAKVWRYSGVVLGRPR